MKKYTKSMLKKFESFKVPLDNIHKVILFTENFDKKCDKYTHLNHGVCNKTAIIKLYYTDYKIDNRTSKIANFTRCWEHIIIIPLYNELREDILKLSKKFPELKTQISYQILMSLDSGQNTYYLSKINRGDIDGK